jgi:hypothetical protein
MSRTALDITSQLLKRVTQSSVGDYDCGHEDIRSLIIASNTELKLSNGFKLAVIKDDGQIVKRGHCVSKAIFEAMSTQVIESFCSRFSAFTEADFKEHK